MRFFKNRQAEMLRWVSTTLKEKHDVLAAKVPALKDFIAEFIEKEEALYQISNGNPDAVKGETLQKKLVKKTFVEVVMKLLSVLNAANYKSRNKQLTIKQYTYSALNKSTVEDLCTIYLKAFAAVKKIKNPEYFGLSPADMRDMQAYYKEFAAVKYAPGARRKEVASKNKELHKGIKECISMLKHTIDPLMRIAAENNPELSMKYKSARMVLAKGQGRPSDAEAAYRKSRKLKTDNTKTN